MYYNPHTQVDAHHDLQLQTLGEKITHGTVFRRALEDGLIDPGHMVMVGLRGGASGEDDVVNHFHWGQQQV